MLGLISYSVCNIAQLTKTTRSTIHVQTLFSSCDEVSFDISEDKMIEVMTAFSAECTIGMVWGSTMVLWQ